MWLSPTQTFNESNHGKQPHTESGVGRRNNVGRGNGGGRRDDIQDETSMVTNIDSNGDNDQEGSSYSLMVNIPNMTENNYNERAQTVRSVLDNKGKFGFLT